MAFVDRVIERSVAGHHEASSAEVGRLIDATYAVIARSGSLDPPIRAILAEADLSNPAFYRHFRSKDELLLVILDEGRRRLVEYLAHRTESCADADEATAEWIRGVMAQAAEPDAARRTRPFVTEATRLHEKFPAEQARSEAQLLEQLATVLGPGSGRWAPLVYTLVFGALERHLRSGSAPAGQEVDDLVAFVRAGIGAQR